MSRIEIRHGERHVIVEHDGELEPIKQAALALFEATDGPQEPPGPAFGFQAERRWTPPAQPSSMRHAPGPWPIQVRTDDPTAPVKSEGDQP